MEVTRHPRHLSTNLNLKNSIFYVNYNENKDLYLFIFTNIISARNIFFFRYMKCITIKSVILFNVFFLILFYVNKTRN